MEDQFRSINKNLQKLGSFTVNDSRIYTTLLMIGLSSPAKISEKSQVDRARVYDSLKRLVKRDIVEEEPVPRAPRYRAIPPEKVFGQIRNRLKNKIKLAENLEKQLKNIKYVKPTENNSVWSIQGEGKIRKQFKQFLEDAEKYCMIILTLDNSAPSIRELENIADLLLEKRRTNPSFSIRVAMKILKESREQRGIINQLFHSNIEVYRWNAGSILPFGLYLTEKTFIQTFLSNMTPKPNYAYGIFMENASDEQLIGFQHMCLWVYSHLCQKVMFKKKEQ
ncbi:hypothetical protein NEF87_004001 [Candidatus Lokiarchaeum ossiferum]|uniref:Transcription regulator TrmB N-terminal domain-containing protein n=1 Tax=Candidatus Lokiarchaeum ossiferum TaxID=2951803 RepID=A0ABY6HYR5_9ARCH|nr:hypothetical protein NEF87_004001 [Candidatus Lokiarchaeum sp. B-35]